MGTPGAHIWVVPVVPVKQRIVAGWDKMILGDGLNLRVAQMMTRRPRGGQ